MVLGPRSGRFKTVGNHRFDSGCFRIGGNLTAAVLGWGRNSEFDLPGKSLLLGVLHAMKGGGEEEGDGGRDPNLRGPKYQRSERIAR